MPFLTFDKNNTVYWLHKKFDRDQIDNDVWATVNANITDSCTALLTFIPIENKDKHDSPRTSAGLDFFLTRFNIEFMSN